MVQTLRDWDWCREATGERWQRVALPHTAVETGPDACGHWQGVCRYRRRLQLEHPRPGETHALYFGAAMHTAEILLDGHRVALHRGGFLPFEVDLMAALADGAGHALEVRLDNRNAADVPPGKPLQELDFLWYGGLYREVELRRYPPLHVTEAVTGDVAPGGGILVQTRRVDAGGAELAVSAHVRHRAAAPADFCLQVKLLDDAGTPRASALLPARLEAGQAEWFAVALELDAPRLWSVRDPFRYTLRVELRSAEGALLDRTSQPCGIRTVSFSRSGGFQLNGERLRLRGTNRHQDHPWVGYALPASAQRRDALRIKAAGFDYVRLSHYPQSPDFLDACDALGIVVMNCLPGWQYLGGPAFRDACEADARAMIRRDRHHPCVVLWELSLNETPMDPAFMERMQAIAREEYPGGRLVTCGWLDHYDVFLRSRQHGQLHDWKNGDKALVVAEYGDWEYYARNEGFDQKRGLGLLDPAGNSRVLRGDGEERLLRQLHNHAEALEDCLASPAVLDGLWSMFDYPRGYDPLRAACGVMDVFRLPKFSFHFYRSQRPPEERGPGWGGPMVFIASIWAAGSDPEVRVFSNLPEVELRLNGMTVGRSTNEPCARTGFRRPLVFQCGAFVPGVLEALGWDGGRVVARHRVGTPGPAAQLEIHLDEMGVRPAPAEADLLFVHVTVRDAEGFPCVLGEGRIELSVEGAASLVSPSWANLEAGVASFLLRCPEGGQGFALEASGLDLPRAVRAFRGVPEEVPAGS